MLYVRLCWLERCLDFFFYSMFNYFCRHISALVVAIIMSVFVFVVLRSLVGLLTNHVSHAFAGSSHNPICVIMPSNKHHHLSCSCSSNRQVNWYSRPINHSTASRSSHLYVAGTHTNRSNNTMQT